MTNEKRVKMLETQIREYDADGRRMKKLVAEAELELLKEEMKLEKPSFTPTKQSDIITAEVNKKKGKGEVIMAKAVKKEVVAAPKVEEVILVHVKDLAEEYNVDPRALRVLLRANGFSAPEVVGAVGFGPRSKYSWPSGSKELAAVRTIIEKHLADE